MAGSQIGKTMITPLNKTATARINPTVSQRPRISIPNLPKNPNRGRPRSQSKGTPVSMATASTNTVASALSQARASGVLSQSKPATPTSQMNSAILLKSQSDSEVETSKTNVNAELSKKLHDERNKVKDRYSQTCIKRSPLGQWKSGLIRQVTSLKRFKLYAFSMTGKKQGDLLIEVTTWAGFECICLSCFPCLYIYIEIQLLIMVLCSLYFILYKYYILPSWLIKYSLVYKAVVL